MKKTLKEIQIPGLEKEKVRITLVGDSPLLVKRFDEKSKMQIEQKQQGKAQNKKAHRDPQDEFQRSLYIMPGTKNQYAVHAGGLKNCAVSACRYVDDINMTFAKGAFHVIGGAGNLVPLNKGTSEPVLDEQMGRIQKKIATPIYRPRFDKWSVTFDVVYNKRTISAEQLINLYENAGFSIGLHEFRPEKGGSFGMFHVKRGK